MKYTYEFLRKCYGLRFRATLSDKHEEGIIKVEENCITLCYGAKDPGRMFIFERTKTLSFTEQTFRTLPNDFEIVPRDPETYHDWQVGDKISKNADVYTVIFRCGEVVLYTYEIEGVTRCCSCPYICEELFRDGRRLVLTDIEKQIIEERKKYKPKDGDIIAWASTIYPEKCAISIYKDYECSYASLFITGTCSLSPNSLDIKFIRPAMDAERLQLFDAMAKEGKRWNAEKKVVEEIPSFKRFDTVLVRDKDDDIWLPRIFLKNEDNKFYVLSLSGPCVYYNQCIPLNEDTEKLIGTSNKYDER